MRILQVSSARKRGGGETHVLSLVRALRASGHEVLVAGSWASPLNPVIKLPFMNSADFWTAFRLRSRLKKESFDIVHAHVARDYSLVTAAAWGIPNVKVVFTRHLLYPVRAHPLYRRVDGWIAPTSQILKTLEPLSPRMSTVIPNWVDVEEIQYLPHSLHNPVTIGILGQISPHKGHDDAIQAMFELGQGFRLLMAGSGDTKYIDALKKKSAELPVELLGVVALADFFQTVDVLIVPSWEEPFGIVLLEAMAAGVPVVATDCGGPPSIIQTALDGVLVPPRNPRALADAIRFLTADHERRSEISRHARAHVEENFDVRRIVPRVEDFYRRVLRSEGT